VLFADGYILCNTKEMSCLIFKVSMAYYAYHILHIYGFPIFKKAGLQQIAL
jgi:hypothetical protein